MPLEALGNEAAVSACRRGAGHDDEVQRRQTLASVPEHFPHLPLDPVALHGRLGNFPGDSDPQPRARRLPRHGDDGEERVTLPPARLQDPAEIFGRAEPVVRRIGETPGVRRDRRDRPALRP